MKFDIKKVVDEAVEKQEKETDYAPGYAVIGYRHSGNDRVFGMLDECLDDAKVWVNDARESVDISQVMVKTIASYDYIPASVSLKWID